MTHRHLLAVISICFCALIADDAIASGELIQPQGEVLLTITGSQEVTNSEEAAAFDFEMLADLPQTTIETTTIWTDGVQEFTGVLLSDLLDVLCIEDGVLHAMAINDYQVDIPVAAVGQQGPIVAHSQNGRPMSVRDKGPLWIIYPYDSAPEYRTEVVYSRSIWQLDRIRVTP